MKTDPVSEASAKFWEDAMEATNNGREIKYIPAVVEQLRLTLKGKNEDYAPTTEFSNFEQAGALVGASPRLAIMLQIGIKYSRLQRLIEFDAEANYEGIRDTLLDLAGYSVIGVAHMDKLNDEEAMPPLDFEDFR